MLVNSYRAGAPAGRAVPYAETVLADMPWAYWKLDEESGTLVADSSGNGRDVSFSGSPVRAQPPLITAGYSTDFNGSASIPIYTRLAELLNEATAFTLEFWLQLQGSGEQRLLDFRRPSGQPGLIVIQASNAATGESSAVLGSSATGNVVEFILAAGPHHLVVVADVVGNDFNVYLDAVSQGAASIGGNTGTADGQIGRRRDANQSWWSGMMDEIAFYGHALSPERIAAHYVAGVVA